MRKSQFTKGDPKKRYARRKPMFIWIAILAVALITVIPALYNNARIAIEINPELTDKGPLAFALQNLLQPFILGIGAIVFGHLFAHQVDLKSILYDWVLNRPEDSKKKAWFKKEVPMLRMALLMGAVTALVAVGFDAVFQKQLPEILQQASSSLTFANILSSVFYQGIAEELLLRWGLMTAAVYILSSQGYNKKDWTYITGLILAVALFSLSRYRSFAAVIPTTTPILWARVAIQGLGGAAFGYLYWKYHLEAAIIGHLTYQVTSLILTAILL